MKPRTTRQFHSSFRTSDDGQTRSTRASRIIEDQHARASSQGPRWRLSQSCASKPAHKLLPSARGRLARRRKHIAQKISSVIEVQLQIHQGSVSTFQTENWLRSWDAGHVCLKRQNVQTMLPVLQKHDGRVLYNVDKRPPPTRAQTSDPGLVFVARCCHKS